VFSSNHTTPGLAFTAALRSNTQQHTATAAASSAHGCTGLPHHCGRNECPSPLRHHQVPIQSVQTPNVTSWSLNDIFKVVATLLQQIMTELNGAESEEDRMIAITKIALKPMKQKTNGYIECRQVKL
jgi:hypothetical protein